MKNDQISSVIAQGIKRAKWISIEYSNKQNELTYYWIAIQDVSLMAKVFYADAFNSAKMDENNNGLLKNAQIAFDGIKRATLLEQTSYDQNEQLISKIETNIDDLPWLKYDEYNDEILDYIELCVKHEEVSFQDEVIMIEGIDHDVLKPFKDERKFHLNLQQTAKLTTGIESLNRQDQRRKYYEVTLALNLLGINTNRGLFVVAYREVTFDPSDRTLVLGDDIIFNYRFKGKSDKDAWPSLNTYFDVETDYFTELYLENPKAATELLAAEVKKKNNQKVDDAPYFMNLVRTNDHTITNELRNIKHRKVLDSLSVPLEAFFGNMGKKALKRSSAVDVMLLDEKANIDQLRVIYNALVQPITYVQGPPGTGKTQTIINILISAFFNGQTVLVSTNNNKPIDDIYDKMTTIVSPDYNAIIPLPILRLGNKKSVVEALEQMKGLIDLSSRYAVHSDKLDRHKLRNKDKAKYINELLSNYEDRLELIENIASMEKMLITDDLMISTKLQIMLAENKEKLARIPKVHAEEIHQMIERADSTFFTWLFFTSVKHIKRLSEPKYESLREIIDLDDEEEKFKAFTSYTTNLENMKLLQRVFPIILTTNQSAHRLGPQGETFDLAIIDEAGQSPIGYALYPISRAKRLLLVGDKNQLRPVVTIPPETNNILFNKFYIHNAYNYINNSILSTMEALDKISKKVDLTYHYRSHQAIANFSNHKYYDGQLKFMRNDKAERPLTFINVDHRRTERPQDSNVTYKEIQTIIRDIKKNKDKNVGVVTPFVNQAEYISYHLKEAGLNNVEVGTVHKFQGDEKDVIYFSTSISKHTSNGAFEWIKDNDELINVALTRAKNRFVLVSDYEEIKNRSTISNNLMDLLKYVKSNGEYVENLAINKAIEARKELKSKAEEELLRTIFQALSVDDAKHVVESHIRVASILNHYTAPEKYDFGLKAEFDFVIFKVVKKARIPVLVIELDGPEHQSTKRRRHNDKLKEQICIENGIKFERIPNDYSRRYLFVKNLLATMLN